MLSSANLNDTYFMVTNHTETYFGRKIIEGKNYSGKSQNIQPTNYSAFIYGFPFTTINFVHKILYKGCYIREVTLPADEPLFQMTNENCTEYYANCVILGQRYDISDLWKIYQKFNYYELNYEIIEIILQHNITIGRVDIIEQIYNYHSKNKYEIYKIIIDSIFNNYDQKLINFIVEKENPELKNQELTLDEFVEFIIKKKIYYIYKSQLDILIKNKKINILKLLNIIKKNENIFMMYYETIYNAYNKYYDNYNNDIIDCLVELIIEKNLPYGLLKMDILMKSKKTNMTDLMVFKLIDKHKIKYNIELVNCAIIYNRIDIIEQLSINDIQLKYDSYAINKAIKNHSWNTLKWLMNSGQNIQYHSDIIGNLMLNADLETLQKWVVVFKKKQFSLRYKPCIINQISEKGRTEILDFWKKNIKSFYDNDAVCYAIRANKNDTIEWWLHSGLNLNIASNTLKFAKENLSEIYPKLISVSAN